MKYTTLLFDIDNTLMDFDGAEDYALKIALGKHGIELTPEKKEVYHQINRALWDATEQGEVSIEFVSVERFRQLAKALEVDVDPQQVSEDYLTHLGEHNTLYPDALELCQDLAPHYTMALATNGVARTQWARLKDSPLTPYFPHIFISEELGAPKPEVGFYTPIFEKLGIHDVSQVLMIGDNLGSDIQGGIQAGIDTLWYNPKKKANPKGLNCTYEVENFQEMRGILLDVFDK